MLGRKSCLELDLIKRIDYIDSISKSYEPFINEKMKIYNRNKCLFEGVGCFQDECKIKLERNAKPIIYQFSKKGSFENS